MGDGCMYQPPDPKLVQALLCYKRRMQTITRDCLQGESDNSPKLHASAPCTGTMSLHTSTAAHSLREADF